VTPEELAMLGKICDVLHSKRVTRFSGAGIEIELSLADDFEANSKATEVPVNPDICRCGHPLYAHMNGGCIEGCEPDKCLSEEELKKASAEG
jgi:hypothetical protein